MTEITLCEQSQPPCVCPHDERGVISAVFSDDSDHESSAVSSASSSSSSRQRPRQRRRQSDNRRRVRLEIMQPVASPTSAGDATLRLVGQLKVTV
jgi:hypothetical protein